jgi:hypothetical protein
MKEKNNLREEEGLVNNIKNGDLEERRLTNERR